MHHNAVEPPGGTPWRRVRGDESSVGLNRTLSVSAWLLIVEQAGLLALLSLHTFVTRGQAAWTKTGLWALGILSFATLLFASAVLFTAARRRETAPTGEKAVFPPPWEAANRRRIHLIDKDLDGTITTSEKTELDELEKETARFLDAAAPLPAAILDDLRRAVREAEGRLGAAGPGGGGE